MPATALDERLESKWVRRLDLLAVISVILLVFYLSRGETLGWFVYVIVAIAVAFLTVIRWPYGAIFVLVGASAVSRFSADFFGWKARPEHFAVAIVCPAACFWLLLSNRRVRLEKIDYWILAYVAANYFSSAFGSSSPSDTLRWALLNNLAVLPYFMIRLLVRDAETLRKAFRILLAVGIAESAYGILCYLSHHAFGTATGMEIAQYQGNIAAPYGSLLEPNLFGAYASCSAVLALAIYLMEKRRLNYLICFFVGSLATVLSFSRGALLALVVATGWVYWQARRAGEAHRSRTARLALAVGLILIVVVPAVGGVVQQRFDDLYNQGLTEQTTISRLIEAHEALQNFSEHPLIGSGTASLQLSFDWGKYFPEMRGTRTWVGNITVRILNDSGLLGLAIIFGFLGSIIWKIRSSLRGRTSLTPVLIALSAGALLYGISFQATDGTLAAFPWVHLGLLSSAAILTTRSGENTSRVSGTLQGST